MRTKSKELYVAQTQVQDKGCGAISLQHVVLSATPKLDSCGSALTNKRRCELGFYYSVSRRLGGEPEETFNLALPMGRRRSLLPLRQDYWGPMRSPSPNIS